MSNSEHESHPIGNSDSRPDDFTSDLLAAAQNAAISDTEDLPPAVARSMQDQLQMLSEVSHIASSMQGRLEELDRREQSINSQVATLEREQRQFRLRVTEFEAGQKEREGTIQAQQETFNLQQKQLNELEARLKHREEELDRREQELTEERDEYQLRMSDELDAEKRKLRESRIACEEEQDKLERLKEKLAEEHRQKLSGLEKRQHEQREELRLTVHRDHEQEVASFSQQKKEWAAKVEQQQEELAAQKMELSAAKAAFEREQEERQEKLQESQTLANKRIQFQEQHLERLREQLNSAQTELKQDQQYARMIQERDHTVMRLRANQLQHFRQLLEQREASLTREIGILGQHRQVQEDQLAEQFGLLEEQQRDWKQRHELDQSDIKRQQNMLAIHAENLEARRYRLEQLQREVEETHRHTLEMKVVVEQQLQALQSSDDSENLSEKVEQARQELSLDYKKLRDELRTEREKLTEQRANLEMQNQLFAEERGEFRQWIEERDGSLSTRQKRLQEIEAKHDEREQAWRTLRQRWLNERVEAEELIRKLLAQLTDLQDPSFALKSTSQDIKQTGEAA